MTAKRIAFDQEAREAIRPGVKQLARAVKVTLGPRGRAFLLEKKWGAPVVSVDGVTVAKEIELKDPYENIVENSIRLIPGGFGRTGASSKISQRATIARASIIIPGPGIGANNGPA